MSINSSSQITTTPKLDDKRREPQGRARQNNPAAAGGPAQNARTRVTGVG
jgi:hypothetical protein